LRQLRPEPFAGVAHASGQPIAALVVVVVLRVLGGILRRRNLTRVPTPQRSPPPPAARRRTPPSSFPSARSPPLEGGPSSHVGHNRRSGLWTSVTGAGLRGGGRHNRRATTLHFHCPLNSAHPSSSSSRCPPHIIPPPAHHSCCLQLAARSINGVRRTPRPLMLAPMCSAADATNAAAAASSCVRKAEKQKKN